MVSQIFNEIYESIQSFTFITQTAVDEENKFFLFFCIKTPDMSVKDGIDEAKGFLPSGFFQRLIGRIVVWSQDTHPGDMNKLLSNTYQVLAYGSLLVSYFFVSS